MSVSERVGVCVWIKRLSALFVILILMHAAQRNLRLAIPPESPAHTLVLFTLRFFRIYICVLWHLKSFYLFATVNLPSLPPPPYKLPHNNHTHMFYMPLSLPYYYYCKSVCEVFYLCAFVVIVCTFIMASLIVVVLSCGF